jgi:DNA repair exonuclease SbcCD ATPase subunit
MKKSQLIALLGFLFLSVSCQKTIEGEQRNFDANIQTLNEVSAKYPRFKGACETLKKDANKQMETARQLSEEKSKIEGMSAANTIASPVWVNNLSQMDSKINEIRDMITKAAQNAKDKNDSDAAWTASRQGEDAISEAKNKLEKADVNNPSDAAAIVSSVMSNLEAAEKRLSDVVKTAQDKVAAEKKAENDAKADEDQKKADEEKKKAPVKCGHCGQSSPAGSTKCGNCSAPLS